MYKLQGVKIKSLQANCTQFFFIYQVSWYNMTWKSCLQQRVLEICSTFSMQVSH